MMGASSVGKGGWGISLAIVVVVVLMPCLGFTNGEKNVMLVGNVFCDQCIQHKLTENAIFLQGVSISIKCKDHEGYNFKTIIATTNEKGYFQANLQGDHAISTCYASTQSNPNVDCNLMGLNMKKPLDFELAHSNGNNLTYSLGYFTFLPLNVPSFCQQTTYQDPFKEPHIMGYSKVSSHNRPKPYVGKASFHETNLPVSPIKKPPMHKSNPTIPPIYQQPIEKRLLQGSKSLDSKPMLQGTKSYKNRVEKTTMHGTESLKAHKPHKHHMAHRHLKSHEHPNSHKHHTHDGTNPPKAPKTLAKKPPTTYGTKLPVRVSDTSKSHEWNIHLPPLFEPKKPSCGPKLRNPPKPPLDGPKPPKPPLDGPKPPKPPLDGPKPPLDGPKPPKPPLDGPKPPKPSLYGPKPPKPPVDGLEPPKDLNSLVTKPPFHEKYHLIPTIKKPSIHVSDTSKSQEWNIHLPPLFGPKPPLCGPKPPKPPLNGPKPPKPPLDGPKPPLDGPKPPKPPLDGPKPPLDGPKPPKPPLDGPKPPKPLANGPKLSKPPMNGSNPTEPPLYGQNPP